MEYRVQFLDNSDNVIRELQADARSAGRNVSTTMRRLGW